MTCLLHTERNLSFCPTENYLVTSDGLLSSHIRWNAIESRPTEYYLATSDGILSSHVPRNAIESRPKECYVVTSQGILSSHVPRKDRTRNARARCQCLTVWGCCLKYLYQNAMLNLSLGLQHFGLLQCMLRSLKQMALEHWYKTNIVHTHTQMQMYTLTNISTDIQYSNLIRNSTLEQLWDLFLIKYSSFYNHGSTRSLVAIISKGH